MKIYFYDGSLDKFPAPKAESYIILDAKYGVSKTLCALITLSTAKEEIVVVSNSFLALNHEFGWNEKGNHTDIYIWSDSLRKYFRVDELTTRVIRRGHNIGKLFLSGEFENELNKK